MLQKNLSCVFTEKRVGCGYHYCVSNLFSPVIAFRTKEGYKNYLERTGLTPEFVESFYSNETGKTEIYKLHGKYEEDCFWSIEEVPENAKRFKGLSNGHYVDCYYAKTNGLNKIFRPNPNAKEVYKPCDFEEHFYYAKHD